MTAPVLGLCLDLNVWCAGFLADKKGATGTAVQSLIEIVRAGRADTIPVQLIMSWGMLTRLRKVFEVDWGVSRPTTDTVIEAIAGYARQGAVSTAPYLPLGGTGLPPIHDAEDAHVLDTAIAARAHLLATANFDDFITTRSHVIEPGRIDVFTTATARLIVAHPHRVIAWLRSGQFPEVTGIASLLRQ